MRVITFNVNGIRSAERKGFARWLARVEGWDVVCLQELKAHADDVPKCLRAPRKCHASFHPAQRKGYAGVGIYARAPATFASGFGSREFDAEGRYLRADFRDLSVISLYLPSGSAGPHRQASKFRFLEEFLPHLAQAAHVGTRDHPVRRLEHRAPGDRPQELAQQPEELGLPARGARLAHARVRRSGLRRRVPHDRSAPRAVHVVVEPRRVVGEERRLAHRLPDRHAGHRRDARAPCRSTRTAASPITRR